MKCRVPRFRPCEMQVAQVQLRGLLSGLHMSLVWISKPVVSRIAEEAMSLLVFHYCLHFSLFVSFVATSAVLCRCFKVMLLDRI